MLLWMLACKKDTPHLDRSEGEGCDVPGNICTWAGVPETPGFQGEAADRLEATLYLPTDLAFAPDGSAYISDSNNHLVRKVDPTGLATIAAGTGFLGDGSETGAPCWQGCDALTSTWNRPMGLAVDPSDPGRLWVATLGGRVVLLDLTDDTLWWWAGSSAQGHVDGPADQATFYFPNAVAAADDGTLYVSDLGIHVIRAISPTGEVSTIAGEPGASGYDGDGGPALQAHLHGDRTVISLLALDGRRLLVVDSFNGVIRAIDLDTGLIETVAGRHESAGTASMPNPLTGAQYEADKGSVPGYSGDGGPALDAALSRPSDVAVGPDGELYIADTGNSCVRVVRSGIISTFAGVCTSEGFSGDGGPANAAQLRNPAGVAVDSLGAVYVTDTSNHVVRRVAP